MRYKRCAAFIMFIAGFFVTTPVSATTYSRDVEVKFTFNSEIQIDIDTADIEILDLTPGQQKDSNVVKISVSTNNVAGYTVSATTGNATYNNTDMTHSDGVNKFTSISTDASESTLSTDNTWGYSTSMGSSQSWANFSGLPIYTDVAKEIAKTDGPSAGTEITQFKIHAKASASQPAGNYRNVITFNVVANVPPRDWPDVLPDDYCTQYPAKCDSETALPTIQSVNDDICDTVETFDTQFQVTDSRDHKTYWISKLRDGNCWMTQNLDLDLKAGVALTSEKTDLGWGSDRSTTSWTPVRSTIPVASITSEGNIPDWTHDNNTPYSIDTGDWYWTDVWYASGEYNYLRGNASDKFSKTPYPGNGTHGHVGNHYNFSASVASNDTSGYTSDTYYDTSKNPQNSICPAGWRLPTIGKVGTPMNEFANLNSLYGNSSTTDEYITASPLYFVRGGQVNSNSLGLPGDQGFYWSSTVESYDLTYVYGFGSGYVNYTGINQRYRGISLRCIARDLKIVVNFDANGGSGSMSAQQAKKYKDYELIANNYTRTGYLFNGWNTKADGLGEGYKDGDTINIGEDITLYAQWLKDDGSEGGIPDSSGGYEAGITIQRAYELAYTANDKGMYIKNQNGSYHEMQDGETVPGGTDTRFAMQDIDLEYNGTKVCDLVTVIGDQYQALDIRDWKLYYISKLADGRCWMTQNLDLRLSTNTTLTPSATDISQPWTPSVSTDDEASWSKWKNGNNQEAIDPECKNSSIPYLNSMPSFSKSGNGLYWNGGKTGNSVMDNAASSGDPHWQIGVYYSFGAALAMDDTSTLAANTMVDQSICPANWRIPDSSLEPGGFPYLMSVYGSPGDISIAPLYSAYTGAIPFNISSAPTYFLPYHTLNKNMTDNRCSDKMRLFQPGNTPVTGPTIPTYYGLTIRCLAR